jgi:hypothetical protein
MLFDFVCPCRTAPLPRPALVGLLSAAPLPTSFFIVALEVLLSLKKLSHEREGEQTPYKASVEKVSGRLKEKPNN